MGSRNPTHPLGNRKQQPVVGTHVDPPTLVLERHGPAIGADPRIDYGEMNSHRHVRNRVSERQRSVKKAPRFDAVRDVDDLDIGGNPLDHTVAGTDEVVLETEVGQKGDEAKAHALSHSRRFATDCQSPVLVATCSAPASTRSLTGKTPSPRTAAEALSAGFEAAVTTIRPYPHKCRRGLNRQRPSQQRSDRLVHEPFLPISPRLLTRPG